MSFVNRVAIITGGGQGIGKAIALMFASYGTDVAIVDVNLENAQAVARECEAMGRKTLAFKVDVTDAKQVEEMTEKVFKHFEGLHILINNAGITRDGLIMRMKEEDWDAVMNVNLKGAFNCIKASLKYLTKQKWGRIINIASIVGEMGNAGQANYAASKAGLIGLTKTVARELASRNVTCNAIAPGFIDTAMTVALSDDVKKKLYDQIPLGRLGGPNDIANAALFLASNGAGYITGHVLDVNGGMHM